MILMGDWTHVEGRVVKIEQHVIITRHNRKIVDYQSKKLHPDVHAVIR